MTIKLSTVLTQLNDLTLPAKLRYRKATPATVSLKKLLLAFKAKGDVFHLTAHPFTQIVLDESGSAIKMDINFTIRRKDKYTNADLANISDEDWLAAITVNTYEKAPFKGGANNGIYRSQKQIHFNNDKFNITDNPNKILRVSPNALAGKISPLRSQKRAVVKKIMGKKNTSHAQGIYSLVNKDKSLVSIYPLFKGQAEGQNLAEFMKSEEFLALSKSNSPQLAIIVLEIFKLIAELHALGHIHRDIKPENIVIAKKNDGSYILQLVDPDDIIPKNATVDRMQGTPIYTPPYAYVIFDASKSLTPYQDIYGALICAMLLFKPDLIQFEKFADKTNNARKAAKWISKFFIKNLSADPDSFVTNSFWHSFTSPQDTSTRDIIGTMLFRNKALAVYAIERITRNNKNQQTLLMSYIDGYYNEDRGLFEEEKMQFINILISSFVANTFLEEQFNTLQLLPITAERVMNKKATISKPPILLSQLLWQLNTGDSPLFKNAELYKKILLILRKDNPHIILADEINPTLLVEDNTIQFDLSFTIRPKDQYLNTDLSQMDNEAWLQAITANTFIKPNAGELEGGNNKLFKSVHQIHYDPAIKNFNVKEIVNKKILRISNVSNLSEKDPDVLELTRQYSGKENESVSKGIYSLGRINGRIATIEHFIQGQELFEFITSNIFEELRKNQDIRLRYIIFNIFRKIAILHKDKKVHSDIKPENIILLDNLDIKLIDFDIAKHIDSAPHLSGTTFQYFSAYALAMYDFYNKNTFYRDIHPVLLICCIFEDKSLIPFLQSDAKNLEKREYALKAKINENPDSFLANLLLPAFAQPGIVTAISILEDMLMLDSNLARVITSCIKMENDLAKEEFNHCVGKYINNDNIENIDKKRKFIVNLVACYVENKPFVYELPSIKLENLIKPDLSMIEYTPSQKEAQHASFFKNNSPSKKRLFEEAIGQKNKGNAAEPQSPSKRPCISPLKPPETNQGHQAPSSRPPLQPRKLF